MRILLHESDINDAELSNSDKKILNLLHTKALPKVYSLILQVRHGINNQKTSSDTWDDEDKKYIEDAIINVDEDIVRAVVKFLKDTLHLSPKDVDYYGELFFNNFNIEGNYKNQLYKQERDLVISPESKLYSELVGGSPLWVIPTDETTYGMPIIYDMVRQAHYFIGDEDESEDALRDYFEGLYIDDRMLVDYIGEEELIHRLEVTDTDKRLIAIDESDHLESEMSDEDIINELDDEDVIWEEYMETKEKIEEYEEEDKDTTLLENKLDKILQKGRESVRERIYVDIYDRLENNLIDYLWELGYIDKTNRGDFRFGETMRVSTSSYGERSSTFDFDLLPGWLHIDVDKIIEREVKYKDFEILSDSSYMEKHKDKEGDIYYVYETDY